MIYAGVGSRKTPLHIKELMERFAQRMAERGNTLRTGHAPNADQAFEWGAHRARGAAEIYLPWPGFERDARLWPEQYIQERPLPEAYTIVRDFHPAWGQLTSGAKALHARNAHQILGRELIDPVMCVVCWTPAGRVTGGTATAIKLAEHYGAEVFNLAMASARDRIEAFAVA